MNDTATWQRKVIAVAVGVLLYLGVMLGCLALFVAGSTVHTLSCNADASYCKYILNDWYLIVFGGTGLALLLLLVIKQIRALKWFFISLGIIWSVLDVRSFTAYVGCGPGARCTTIYDHDAGGLLHLSCLIVFLGFPILTSKRVHNRLQRLRTKTGYLIFLLVSLIASSAAIIIDILTAGGISTALGTVGALASICGLLAAKRDTLRALLRLNPQAPSASAASKAATKFETPLPPARVQTLTPGSISIPDLRASSQAIHPPATASPPTTEPPTFPVSRVSSGKALTPAGPPSSPGAVALSASPQPSPLHLSRLGNYRLLRLLGQGGFASVYLAEHRSLGSLAAIKVLHTTLTQEDQEQFRREGRMLAHLIHPHIIRVLDFDVEGPLPFLVMDYAPGGTLRARYPKGSKVPLPQVASYVQQIASALDYAHREKLIHRDIKPENLLLGREQQVLLSDFGIAVLAHQSSSLSTQNVAGTASYMAPEHIQGKPRPASDQYALAVVVYEWISGLRPFQGSFTELCTQHLFAAPPPLRATMPALPASLEQVILTALAKDPHRRFESCGAFAQALQEEVLAMKLPLEQTPPRKESL
jgi:serine/threonine protein kinase